MDPRLIPTLRGILIELAVILAVGVALAFLGPYGSFAMGPLATRVAYWVPAALGGYLIVRPTTIATALAARKLDLPPAAGLGAGALVGAVPLSIFVLWLNGNGWRDIPSFADWLQLYAQVALIGAGVTTLYALLERPAAPMPERATPAIASGPSTASSPVPPAASPFLDRLPPHMRDRLIALEMEDHYVRAHAPGTSTLVLLRMRDAVAELGGVDGMRVHRSWWVARDAVVEAVQDGRTIRLKLEGGLEAPVARSSVPTLRAAGWLA